MTNRPRLGAILAASLLWLAASVGPSSAQPSPLDARLIWMRGDDLYLAAPDSVAVGPGTLLTLISRGKVLGTATVTRAFDRAFAVARVTSGSLREVKDMRRIRVLAEPAQAPRRLRVGYPSRARSHLLFDCVRMPFNRTAALRDHQVEETAQTYRVARVGATSSDHAPTPWPDTVDVRLFDDAADQEIALERGELDVAVFWPGELSTHMRERSRWKDHLSGTMARGLIGTIRLGPEAGDGAGVMASREADALAAMNRELFRGDLEARIAASGPARRESSPAGPAARIRFEVDASFPGRTALQAFLDRGHPPATEHQGVIRLFRLECECREPESILRGLADHIRSGPYPAELRARADSLVASAPQAPGGSEPPHRDRQLQDRLGMLGVSFPLAIACPVLCDPALLPYVGALGADAFVNLLECRDRER